MSYCDDYENGCCYNPEDFLEVYEVKIREIMAEAVNVKIKNQLEELAQIKADYKHLEEVYYKNKHELSSINRQHEQKMKQVIIDTEFAVHRKLGLGFAVGDTVYYMENKPSKTKCEKCKDGKVDVDVFGVKKTVSCPFCSYGLVHVAHYQPKSGVINSIKFYISEADRYRRGLPGVVHDQNTEYHVGDINRYFQRSKIYKTLEECQAACDAENVAAEEKALKKANGEETK